MSNIALRAPVMASLPPCLTEILDAKDEAAVWMLRSAPAAAIRAARESIPVVQAQLDLKAPKSDRERWIVSLGLLCRTLLSADEAKVQVRIYTDMLADQPSFVFSRDSLVAAGKRFTWWPAFQEVDEFLTTRADGHRLLVSRLTRLSKLPSDEDIAAARQAEEAARLAEKLSTPRGRIRHKHFRRFFLEAPTRAGAQWYDWVAVAVAEFPEAMVDRWHEEVAALEWGLDIDPLAELRSRADVVRATAAREVR